MAVHTFPQQSRSHRQLGEAYISTGNVDAAIKQYQTAAGHILTDYLFPKLLGDVFLWHYFEPDYANAVDAYKFAIDKAQNQSFLSVYLHINGDVNKLTIAINEQLVKSFVWHSFVEACKGMGDLDRVKVCKTVIKEYEAAIAKTSNTLLWK